MFKKIILLLALICVMVTPVFALGGTYTTYGHFYLPAYGAFGLLELAEYNAYMQIADTQIESNKTEASKNKWDATEAPDADNDVDEGYLAGSTWVDVTNDKAYVCCDNTDGAAVWKVIAPSGGSVGISGTPEDDDWARFVNATDIEGLSDAELIAALSLEAGVDIQAYDAGLLSIAGLTTAANRSIYTTALDTYAVYTLTAFGRSILDDADEAAFKATVNLEIDTDVLAYQAIGIADDNLVEIDDADAADNDYAKITAAGLEGRSYSETRNDLQNYTVYPQDYATGAGTSGDPWAGSCIEDAYAACPTGGTIFLGEGYYLLNGELGLEKAINIVGEGMGKTFIVCASGTADGLTLGETDYITLRNFTIDGDGQTLDTADQHVIGLDKADYALIENVELKEGGYYGLDIFECNYGVFQNIWSHDNQRHGVHTGSNTGGLNKYNTYQNIYCYDNVVNGFDSRGCSVDPTLLRNNIYNNLQCWGNVTGILFEYMSGSRLSNSFSISNSDNGLYMHHCDFIFVSDTFISSSGDIGIELYETENLSLVNVVSKNNDGSCGIYVDNGSAVRFTNCQFYDDRGSPQQDYGIFNTDSSNVDYVRITSCKLSPNETANVYNGSATDFMYDVTDETVCTDLEGTYLSITTGTLNVSGVQPLEATLTDIADGTINENLVNTANPWANNEVADDITIDLAATATALATGRTIGGVSFDGTANIIPRDSYIYHALGSDHQYSGVLDTVTAGENVVFGQILYHKFSDDEWYLAKADAWATAHGEVIALESKSNGQECLVLRMGYIRDDSAFDFGASTIYLNDDTAGTCDDTAPAESEDRLQVVGTGMTADILYFNPSQDVGEI